MAAAPHVPGRYHRHDRRTGRGPPPPANPNALVRSQPSKQDASGGRLNTGGHDDGNPGPAAATSASIVRDTATMAARTCAPRDGERSRLVAVAVAAPVRPAPPTQNRTLCTRLHLCWPATSDAQSRRSGGRGRRLPFTFCNWRCSRLDMRYPPICADARSSSAWPTAAQIRMLSSRSGMQRGFRSVPRRRRGTLRKGIQAPHVVPEGSPAMRSFLVVMRGYERPEVDDLFAAN